MVGLRKVRESNLWLLSILQRFAQGKMDQRIIMLCAKRLELGKFLLIESIRFQIGKAPPRLAMTDVHIKRTAISGNARREVTARRLKVILGAQTPYQVVTS